MNTIVNNNFLDVDLYLAIYLWPRVFLFHSETSKRDDSNQN